jgi:uncharacterized protein
METEESTMQISRRGFAVLAGAAALASPAFAATSPRILVFHKATGYVHPSIETGKAMLTGIAARDGYDIETTDDPDIFSAANLARFDAIVLLCCTTDSQHADSEWLVGPRRDALQAFVRSTKGVVGIHAAADSHHHWPWYGQLIGGYFDRHPANPNVRPGHLIVVDRDDPSTRGLPARIDRSDEWYLFRDFNPMVHLLIAAEVSSVYDEGSDPLNGQWFSSQTNTNTRMRLPEANPKPISWRHDFESSRVFYTAMGHVPESFTNEPLVNMHISGGLKWALRRENLRTRRR